MKHSKALIRAIALSLCLVFLVAAASLSVGAQAQTSIPATSTAPPPPQALFDGEAALKLAAAQTDIGIRPTGSEAGIKTGDFILKTLADYGWKTSEQPFDINVNGQIVKGRNLIGSLGSGPVIVLAAHFDTRLWADNDPDLARRHDPVMGANDAASGVAVLLELARVLGKGYDLNHEIRLVFLDAEDNGNIPGWKDFSIGTAYYVKNLDTKPVYAIILDMIGDSDLNIYYEGYSMQSAPELMTAVWDVADALGYAANFIPTLRYTMIDDHRPFIDAGIKAIDIIDFDYPFWHTVSDTLDKVSAASLEKMGRTLQVFLEKTGVIRPVS